MRSDKAGRRERQGIRSRSNKEMEERSKDNTIEEGKESKHTCILQGRYWHQLQHNDIDCQVY